MREYASRRQANNYLIFYLFLATNKTKEKHDRQPELSSLTLYGNLTPWIR